jgi:hypothetical protein
MSSRVLHKTVLVATLAIGVVFLVSYAIIVRQLLEAGFGTGNRSFPMVCFDLRNDINVVVWKAFPQCRPWAHDGWSLLLYGDAPEGTKAVYYFPSLYVLIPLSAVFGFEVVNIIKLNKRRVIQNVTGTAIGLN